ncbi:hypothetical protein O0I10_004267 [Lichtheimia ornata]|uniref:ABC transporter domain-containing protein n=1 Tax=Lichtheimia ornata TaxID=688661 RepID=A0AAD7V730_9FUNG|nr:uncharacterized protein O0I10_004267 [Lichtheimia ornata]KAJ8660040.1 hypothetical protein O0I10_004267 [Lichtheimia ornata]
MEKSNHDSSSTRSDYTIHEDITYKQEIEGNDGTYGEPDANAVNIDEAKLEYDTLKRELSRISRASVPEGKAEEGAADQEVFDLDAFLHDMSNQESSAGHKPKHLGVLWKDLVVEGLGADAHVISNVASACLDVLQFWKYFGIGKKSTKKTILRGLNGFCKNGEMLLVLGRPGAGCTTLLKVLSCIRSPYTHVGGEVTYGGIDYKTFSKHYRGQVVYNEEEDQHYPTLTTKQTLQFALRTKTPGTRLPDETKRDFVDKIIYLLGNMLGLTKQMDTVVGNAFVRGLSGGERKRLSIAEVMTTRSTITCFDCSTRGLDAASALDYVRSLRIMTDVFGKTTIATLYQASNSIFNLFDKVLLLDEGHCIYFGPTSEAKAYFEHMGFHCPPRKSLPDFLTGLCNPLEREVQPGFDGKTPEHAHEFEERFYESSTYKAMMAEMQAYEEQIARDKPAEQFMQAMRDEHQKLAPKSQPHTSSFWQQVKALTIRQHQLLIKDHEGLLSRYGTIFVQSLITGSVFFSIPLTANGAFSRSGALFFAVLFNALVSQSTLISFFLGRPVLEKQKHFAMYRPSAYYLSIVAMDIPYAVVQVLVYEICSYFLMHLDLDAGRWFTYFIILIFINLAMNGFFRFFGTITSSFFVATQVSGALFVALVTYSGYVIPYQTQHPWLYWIYWINPLAYGYRAIVSNELTGQHYSCDGLGNSVPYGPGYDDWNYKVCTMQGGNPGEDFVLGDDYLFAARRFRTWWRWAPDFVVVVGFFLFFTALNCLAMEKIQLKSSGSLTKLYLPGKAPKPRTDEEENARREHQAHITDNMAKVSTGTTFSWHNVNYTVPVKGGTRQLLNDISGIVRPGHLTALMGSSGAGKTTLLDVLAKRKTIGKVEGDVFLNNEALMNDFERITGYCEQMDIHQPAVTVREALQFSAYLRQDADVPKEEKDAYVETILTLLEMEDIADAQIGEVELGVGISVEERKRLTIGMELVSKPKLLFLDEPTSGLDAQSSYNIVRFIRKLADAGWPVLCTIHQPSAILFEHFDHLLLLVRGGRTAYHGEIGPDARTMIDYFESNGGPKCSPDANPAEYILEVVGAGTAGKATRDWADIWAGSPQAKALQEELDLIKNQADMHPTRPSLQYATPFTTQFHLVLKRMLLVYWRSPEYNIGRFATLMFNSLLTGFTFWKMSNTQTDMQNRIFALFGTFIMSNILIILSQPKFMTERLYFRREYASRYYGWLPFALCPMLVEMPYIIFFSATYMCGFYWTGGFANTSEACGYFFILVVFFVFYSVSIGFLIAAITENPTSAASINPLVASIFILFAGLMQPEASMPYFWRKWMYWLDPFHYYIEGLATNELSNVQVTCNSDDLLTFNPPPNQTCGEYMTNFFNSGGSGYIDNPNDTTACQYCAYSSGTEFFEQNFGWSASNKWRDLGIMIAFFIFDLAMLIIVCYFKRKPRR